MENYARKMKIFLHGHDKSVVVDRSAGNSVEYTADLSNRGCGEKWDFPLFHRTVESLSTPSAGLAGAKKGDLSRFWENFDEFHKLSRNKLCKTSFFHTVFHSFTLKFVKKTVEKVENSLFPLYYKDILLWKTVENFLITCEQVFLDFLLLLQK